MYPIHEKPTASYSFDRLDMLWERYPQYHERTTFGTLEDILEEHESYQKDFDEDFRDEYLKNDYGRFLVNLSWSDLAYRYATKELITASPPFQENPYVASFMGCLKMLSTDFCHLKVHGNISIIWNLCLKLVQAIYLFVKLACKQ